MAALEEFELGIDHIRNAFKRADNGFTNAYKMLEAEQQKNHKLEAENEKLWDELDQWHRLTAGIELPEYPITEFHPKDLERENAELRELARDLRFCARQSICLKCEHGRICDLRLDERCAELGIEVDG